MSTASQVDLKGYPLREPKRYRSKLDGTIVEAIQWVTWNQYAVTRFLMETELWKFDRAGNILLYTGEYVLLCQPMDWIVRNPADEYSVCNRLFDQLYEEIEAIEG